jgi:hypothetical protein
MEIVSDRRNPERNGARGDATKQKWKSRFTVKQPT